MIAPTSATPAATSTPGMQAVDERVLGEVGEPGDLLARLASTIPSDCFMSAARPLGTGLPRRKSPTWEPYTEASTLPMTATPNAPPTWRVVSFTADPTPALANGSEPMIDSVAGAIVSAMPHAINAMRHTTSGQYALFTCSVAIEPDPT